MKMLDFIKKIINILMGMTASTNVTSTENVTTTKTVDDNAPIKETNETNREEIKNGLTWRNALGYICVAILAYSYILIPIADYFGIALIQMPLGDIIRIIILLTSGG